MRSHVPNEVMRTNNRIARVDMRHVPSPHHAVRMYHEEGGFLMKPTLEKTQFVLILLSAQSEHKPSMKGFRLFILFSIN